MLITAQINSIDPFSRILFEEFFEGDLPVFVNIDATADVDIVANVIKTVVPEEIDATATSDVVANRLRNTEEISIDATTVSDISAFASMFTSVDIDATTTSDIIASLIAEVPVDIDAITVSNFIANKIKSTSVSADFTTETNIIVNKLFSCGEISIDATTASDIIANRLRNTENLAIGSNLLLDLDGIVRFDLSGEPRSAIGSKIVASIIKSVIFDEEVLTSTDIVANTIKNTEEMSIDATTEVTIDANVI